MNKGMDTTLGNRWNLVIHAATRHSVTLWIGTLFHNLRKPQAITVKVINKRSSHHVEQVILKNQWERPFRTITTQRFYKQLSFSALTPNTEYEVEVYELLLDGLGQIKRNDIAFGSFTTLPNTLSELENGLTVALGSCFYDEYDGGATGLAYESLVKTDAFPFKPHLKFLTGDQVYLDIGWDSLSLIPKEVRERVADDYAKNWQGLRRLLRHGSNYFLSDDHEFWNNYPLVEGWSPFIQALHYPKVKSAWLNTAKDGVKIVQGVKPVRFIHIGDELSFCLVDLRAFRTRTNILPDTELQKVIQWIEQLTTPGVLVLSQPLMVKKSGNADRNFPFYARQYRKVIKAIHNASHDVLSLSGDVHHGRISSVKFKGRRNKLVEIVSSPLSNLASISSIATSTISKRSRLKTFPPVSVSGVSPVDVSYDAQHWRVSSEFKWFDLRYLQRRTHEHFSTLTFTKDPSGRIAVNVRVWLVRKQDHKTGLPKQQWPDGAVRLHLE